MTDKTKTDDKSTKTRTATEVTRTGHGNGGGVDAKAGLRAGVSDRSAPADTGDRETASPAEKDKIWTQESKERWGADQPSLQDQLAAQRKTEEKIRKDAEK